MNCRRVEKLIPLYVEGDLKSRVSDPVASHLEWCGRCNWLADEFRESQNWLHSSELPDFDEAFLDSFKADALKLIAETNSKPSLLSSLMQQWNRRQVFALSAAILIIAGVFVFYVYQAGTNAKMIHVADTTVTTEPEGTPAPEPQRAADMGHDSRVATGAASRAPHRMKTPASAKERTDISLVPTQTIESSLPTHVGQLEGPGSGSLEPAANLSGSDDLPPMLRIEMQTSDPNIRIIWFAPREVERPKTNQ